MPIDRSSVVYAFVNGCMLAADIIFANHVGIVGGTLRDGFLFWIPAAVCAVATWTIVRKGLTGQTALRICLYSSVAFFVTLGALNDPGLVLRSGDGPSSFAELNTGLGQFFYFDDWLFVYAMPVVLYFCLAVVIVEIACTLHNR